MMTSPRHMTILFADIAGSVDLYSKLGDFLAHQQIGQFQQLLSLVIEENHGRVIEVIGDEVMCAFDHVDHAFSAACHIQAKLINEQHHGLHIRIGFHSGMTSGHDNQPFGDTVNIAARVVAIAKAGQIMLTDQSWHHLSPENRLNTSLFNKVSMKGKSERYTIHQAMWDREDRTILSTHEPVRAANTNHKITSILLQADDRESSIEYGSEVLIGRGEQCQIRIDSRFASRVHATIRCHKGKMILTDRSANGTFIRTLPGHHDAEGNELFLRQDEWTTTGNGVFSLGEPFTDNSSRLIYFRCT